jgi:hypothetical protein
MGVFGKQLKLNEARESGGGIFFLPRKVKNADPTTNTAAEYDQGIYTVDIDVTKIFDSRKKETYFVAETIIKQSNVPERGPGTRCSWMMDVNGDAAASNIRSLMIALTGSALGRTLSSDEIEGEDWDAVGEAAVSSNRFKAVPLHVTAFYKLKKDKRPQGLDAALDSNFYTRCLFNVVLPSEKEQAA